MYEYTYIKWYVDSNVINDKIIHYHINKIKWITGVLPTVQEHVIAEKLAKHFSRFKCG